VLRIRDILATDPESNLPPDPAISSVTFKTPQKLVLLIALKVHLHHFLKMKSLQKNHRTVGIKVVPLLLFFVLYGTKVLFLLDDRKIRIRTSD
jgi:hypothetical protein